MSITTIITRLITAVAIGINGASATQAQNHIQWSFDLDQAIQIATSENKLVMLHFTATWCGPCKDLDRFVFVNPATIRAISAHVVPVKIDVDVQKYIAEKYQVKGVPTDVIITPAGEVVSTQASPRSSDGYLQMLASARSASENPNNEAIANRSRIVQAMTDNHPAANSQSSMVEKYRPNGAQATGQPGAGEIGMVTNKFYSPNQSLTTPYGQTFASTNGSFNPNQQQSTESSGSMLVNNKFASQNKPASGGGDFGASVDIGESGMKRIENPFVTPTENVSLAQETVPQSATDTDFRSDESTTRAVSLPPIGLDGYCGVTLMEEQRWVRGNEQFGCIHRGKLYFFASNEHLERFQMTPDMFSPLLGGADPVEFHDSGQLVDGQRKLGIFYGEPGEPNLIVLFDSKSNKERFEADPPTFVQSVRQAMSKVDGNTLIR